MIAVWLVGPPSVVASATTRAGSRPAVSAGARSSAHRIDGTSGSGTPGSGSPLSSAMHTVADVPQIGDPFGHQSAELGEQVDELLDGRLTARDRRGCRSLMCFSAAPSQARSCASVAVAASTSDAAPVACAARSRSRLATAVAAAANRAGFGRAIAFLDVCRRCVVDDGQSAGPDHRRVLNTGDHRDTPQNGARRVLGGRGVGRK